MSHLARNLSDKDQRYTMPSLVRHVNHLEIPREHQLVRDFRSKIKPIKTVDWHHGPLGRGSSSALESLLRSILPFAFSVFSTALCGTLSSFNVSHRDTSLLVTSCPFPCHLFVTGFVYTQGFLVSHSPPGHHLGYL